MESVEEGIKIQVSAGTSSERLYVWHQRTTFGRTAVWEQDVWESFINDCERAETLAYCNQYSNFYLVKELCSTIQLLVEEASF